MKKVLDFDALGAYNFRMIEYFIWLLIYIPLLTIAIETWGEGDGDDAVACLIIVAPLLIGACCLFIMALMYTLEWIWFLFNPEDTWVDTGWLLFIFGACCYLTPLILGVLMLAYESIESFGKWLYSLKRQRIIK